MNKLALFWEYVGALTSTYNWILKVLNSNFSAALAGALAGAYIAQRISRRDKYRDELISEIRNTNAATSLAASICNAYLNFKDQQVIEFRDLYNTESERFSKFLETLRTQNPDRVYKVEFNLRIFPPINVPTEPLEKIVFERISITGKPLITLTTLILMIRMLDAALRSHTEFTHTFREWSADEKTKAHKYFGHQLGVLSTRLSPPW